MLGQSAPYCFKALQVGKVGEEGGEAMHQLHGLKGLTTGDCPEHDSPTGDRLWYATATARSPAAIIRTFLDAVAAEETRATGPEVPVQAVSAAASALLEAGWRQADCAWGLQWSAPDADAIGLWYDARAVGADSWPAWTAWGGSSIDQPTWSFCISLHAPAAALQDLGHELARQAARRPSPAASPRPARQATSAHALPPQSAPRSARAH
ncbi:hypothetical protein [Streptomyces sp. CB02923]|uniref:hypothetical protein n=1 Tax=Streptomyces sp. CB02923 TaxID=1718985 RepID=UPI00093F284D|nr:hypothetical protein [Streptomyces sp. CB02923]